MYYKCSTGRHRIPGKFMRPRLDPNFEACHLPLDSHAPTTFAAALMQAPSTTGPFPTAERG